MLYFPFECFACPFAFCSTFLPVKVEPSCSDHLIFYMPELLEFFFCCLYSSRVSFSCFKCKQGYKFSSFFEEGVVDAKKEPKSKDW